MDKEIFECDEFERGSEVQLFPAEDYRSRESTPDEPESFSGPEIGGTAGNPKVEETNGLSEKDVKKVLDASSSASSSASAGAASMTASVSVAASATTVVASVAAVAVAAVTGVVSVPGIPVDPFFGEDISTSQPVVVPSYGTYSFLRYRVEYLPNNDGTEVDAYATFYFTGEQKEGLTYWLFDLSAGEGYPLEGGAFYAPISRYGDSSFEFRIMEEENILRSEPIVVMNHYVSDGSEAITSCKFTYNEDGTSNAYFYFSSPLNEQFDCRIEVADYETEEAIEGYETKVDGNRVFVEGITQKQYTARLISDISLNGNLYSYYSSYLYYVGDRVMEWSAEAVYNRLTIGFGDQVSGEITVEVTYPDDQTETFSFMSTDLIDGRYTHALSRTEENLRLSIKANARIYDYDYDELIQEVNGSNYFPCDDSCEIVASVSKLSLERLEVFDSTYSINDTDGLTVPVNLRFKGSLAEGDSYAVRVFGEGSEEVVAEQTNLTSFDGPIRFLGLHNGGVYTFRYYLTVEGVESLVGEITQTLSIIEHSGTSGYYFSLPFPSDALVTYNSDHTSNLYYYMDPQETSEDIYYIFRLFNVDYEDHSVFYEAVGKDSVAVFQNIPNGTYAVTLAVMLLENGVGYSIEGLGWPSGSVNVGLDDNGYYPSNDAGYLSYDPSTKKLDIGISGRLEGDLTVTLTDHLGTPTVLTIPKGDVEVGNTYSSVELDLSTYEATVFLIDVEGEAAFFLGEVDLFPSSVVIQGTEYCPFKLQTSYGIDM